MTKGVLYGKAVNDADYVVKYRDVIDGKIKHKCCPIYSVWKDLIRRCLCQEYKDKHPAYADTICCDEWLLFSNFKSWMEQQDWEGKQLDKDLLILGNKIYSPETCVFVSQRINKFILENPQKNNPYMKGVNLVKSGKFIAYGRTVCGLKTVNLGTYTREIDAHKAWLNHKIYLLTELREEINNDKLYETLLDRYKDRLIKVEMC